MTEMNKEELWVGNCKTRLNLNINETTKNLKFRVLKNGTPCSELRTFDLTVNGIVVTPSSDTSNKYGSVAVRDDMSEYSVELNVTGTASDVMYHVSGCNLDNASNVNVTMPIDTVVLSLNFDTHEHRTLECWVE